MSSLKENPSIDSHKIFRSFFEYNPLMCFIVTSEGLVRDVNIVGAEELEYTKEELLGKSVFGVFYPDDKEIVKRLLSECLREPHRMHSWELRKIKKKGGVIWVREAARVIEDEVGSPLVLISCENITSHRHVEEELKKNKAALQAVIENTSDFIWSVDLHFRILTMNSRFRDMFQLAYKTRLATGLHVLEPVPQDVRLVWEKFYIRAFRGEQFRTEQHFDLPGMALDVEINFNPIVNESGLVSGASVFARDITESKRKETALREIEERYRQMFDENKAVKWLIDPETGAIVDANSAASEYYGYPLEKLRTMTIFDINTSPSEKIRSKMVDAQISFGTYNFRHRLADGEIRDVELHTGPIIVKGKRLLFSIIHDVTERRRSEQALKESEEKYRSIFENISEGIYQATEDGRFITINPSLVKMLGYASAEDVMRLNLDHDIYVHEDDRKELNRMTLAKGKSSYVEVNWKKKDGTVFLVRLNDRAVYDSSGRFQYFEVTVEDVSEQRKLEQHVIQSQKIESMGRIAGGVAHDMNNMLAVILPTAEMLKSFPQDTELVKNYAEVISSSARRAADIVKQLLVFSRKAPERMSPMDLNALIRETRKMLEHVIGKDIKIQTELEAELPYIEADVTQMQQILMNLSVNARDAIVGSGTLLITTRHVWLDERACRDKENLQTGHYVELKVSDTGSGIPEDILPKIFDAFFSTKHAGQGTGLGLAVVKSIVLKHRGAIEVHSTPGKGSTFTVFLPVMDRYAETSLAELSKDSPKGTERLLIVDDEVEILHVTDKIFSDLGYRVKTAESGTQAVEMYKESGFDLVLLDIQMPGIDGRETFRRLREIDPKVKVLYTTGYAKPEVISAIEQHREAAIVQKPFSIQELAKAIREALKS